MLQLLGCSPRSPTSGIYFSNIETPSWKSWLRPWHPSKIFEAYVYLLLRLCQNCSVTIRSSLAIEISSQEILGFYVAMSVAWEPLWPPLTIYSKFFICSCISRDNLCHVTKRLSKFLSILTYHLFERWLVNLLCGAHTDCLISSYCLCQLHWLTTYNNGFTNITRNNMFFRIEWY